jgi:hypothetical protein
MYKPRFDSAFEDLIEQLLSMRRLGAGVTDGGFDVPPQASVSICGDQKSMAAAQSDDVSIDGGYQKPDASMSLGYVASPMVELPSYDLNVGCPGLWFDWI